jgi:hypothetical protein
MPPSAEELRELQKKAIQSVENPVESRSGGDAQISGLSKRDYVPLAVALFVDLCLFLVSMGQRPGGRLDGLVPKMQAAERGPVIEILSRFNDIHRDKQIRENFELFRHVVFDMNGDYYVAVPLDAPPRLNPAERENLRVEAQLLSNLFASFEREKIFKRTLLPTTGSIQKRLARQGSKFAGSESFRVYKFTNGAWSDIILGAVMGAARRAERRDTGSARDSEQDTVPSASAPQPQQPASSTASMPSTSARADVAPEERDARDEPPPPPKFNQNIRPPRPNVAIDAEHAARFGPYANVYQPEPEFAPPQAPRVKRPPRKPDPEADVTVVAANSNTSDATPIAPPPLPATVMTIPRNAPVRIDREEEDSPRPVDRHASVTLQRETATFTVPVSEAVMPDSLKAAMRAFGSRTRNRESTEPAVIANDFSDEPEVSLSDDDHAFIRRIAPPAAE